jgi:hypothetical protein
MAYGTITFCGNLIQASFSNLSVSATSDKATGNQYYCYVALNIFM